MDRREFLTAASMAALASLLPASAHANAMLARAEEFRAALQAQPWLLGWQSAPDSQVSADAGDIHLEGRIPEGLNGNLYRNGVGAHDVAGHRYRHWFDGDGMVQRYHIANGSISHRASMIATPKRLAEQAAGRPLFDTFGTHVPQGARVRSADQMNTANISVLQHGGRLMALWEGGSPSEIDPETLDFRGFVRFSPETTGLPFSAHTRTDPDGTLWSIGYAGYAGTVFLWQIGADGRLKKITTIAARPTPMLHDFLLTERHVVLIMTPWRYHQNAGETFLDRHVWEPEKGGQALIIDKNDHSIRHRIDLPPFWVFHFANAWEESNGRIHLDFPIYADPSNTIDGFVRVMHGEAPRGRDAHYVSAVIDPKRGTWNVDKLIGDAFAEFPSVPRDQTGKRHRHSLISLIDPNSDAPHPGFTNLARIDHQKERIDGFAHAATEMAEEALFVPSDQAGHSGWVLQTVLDFAAEATRLKIFEADDLSSGPVALATLPYALPLGLHGLFVPEGG